MSRAIFLANPELNIDDIVVTHSTARGRRAGVPVAAVTNSGYMFLTAIGDSGDGVDRIIEIRGQDRFPRYIPKDAAGVDQYTDLEGSALLTTLTVTAATACVLVEVYDRLHLVTLEGNVLAVYTWDGAAFVLRSSQDLTDNQTVSGPLCACQRGDNIYIGVADNALGELWFYRFNARSFALSEVAEGALAVTDPNNISMASDGALFVLLHEVDLGSGLTDIQIATGGDLSSLSLKANSFLDLFATAWGGATSITKPVICWTPPYGFVAIVEVSGFMRCAYSPDGEDWMEFRDIRGDLSQPTITTGFGPGVASLGLAAEGLRIFTYRRPTAGGIDMMFFNGRRLWQGEFAANGGAAVVAGASITACNWRGTIYYAWPSTATAFTVRKGNLLTTTVTNHTRHMQIGRRNYVDGAEDDSRVALFFTPRGPIHRFDSFTIPAAYDRRGANVLSEVLSETWRADDAGTPYVQFDAGANRKFALDSLALFHTNMPSATLTMDDDVAFGSPSTTQVVSATVKTAAIVSVNADTVTFAADTFISHEYASRFIWVQFTSGLVGIFLVLDNTDSTLTIDGDATGATGTATLFGDRMGYVFAAAPTPQRYVRLTMPNLTLPDDYYEIGRAVFGKHFRPTRNYAIGFGWQHSRVVSTLELRTRSKIATKLNLRGQRTWDLTLPLYGVGDGFIEGVCSGQPLDEVIGFFSRLADGGEQFAFWPNWSSSAGGNADEVDDLNDVVLVRVERALDTPHLFTGYHDANFVLVEEV